MFPIVSIIIPVYNVAPYLREALDSVVNQTCKHLEIIVIDDGSTDLSGSICDEYSSTDPRFVIIHQNRQGVSAARNAGLDVATGEYIAFLDPDDAYDTSFISSMLDTLLRMKSDIVVCKYKVYYTDNKMDAKKGSVCALADSREYNRIQALQGLLDGKLNMAIWNKLYKRDLWKNVRFRTELTAASDHLVSFQVFDGCNSAYVIDNPLYLYRVRQASISRNFSAKNVECQILARSLVTDYLKSHSPADFSEMQIKKYEVSRLNSMIYYYIRCQDSAFSDFLKKQTIEMAEKIGIENCGYKTRIAYHMMRHCSWLLRHSYPVYFKIRVLVRNVFGR